MDYLPEEFTPWARGQNAEKGLSFTSSWQSSQRLTHSFLPEAALNFPLRTSGNMCRLGVHCTLQLPFDHESRSS